MQFVIAPEVFAALPSACFGVVAVKGAKPGPAAEEIRRRLAEAVESCTAALEGVAIKQAPEIVPYREAFRALGINPNKYPCSIEALLTRIAKGKGCPPSTRWWTLATPCRCATGSPSEPTIWPPSGTGCWRCVRPGRGPVYPLWRRRGGDPRPRGDRLCFRRGGAHPALDLAPE